MSNRVPDNGWVNSVRYAIYTILLIVCCAVFYYRVGEFESGSGGWLALLSLALWAVGIFALRFGWLGNLLVQVGLFLGLTIWNMTRQKPK